MLNKTLTLLFIFCLNHFVNAQIQHVEPLNWWVGLKNPNLQLLIHGENISETQPSINYPGVSIKKVNKADSKNYLFLDLIIAKTTKAGSFTINFKKAGKIVYTYNYSLLPKQQSSAQMRGFNSSDVIYLITPDRFVNGNYSNDVVIGMKESKINRSFDGGRHGGDIRGMINSLDYIANMGFTAIGQHLCLKIICRAILTTATLLRITIKLTHAMVPLTITKNFRPKPAKEVLN